MGLAFLKKINNVFFAAILWPVVHLAGWILERYAVVTNDAMNFVVDDADMINDVLQQQQQQQLPQHLVM